MDEELFQETVQKARRGDREATEVLMAQVLPKVLAALQRRFSIQITPANDCADAIDSATASFLLALRADKYTIHNSNDLAGLLIQFAINKARGYLRKRREVHVGGEDNAFDPEDQSTPVDDAILNADLDAALLEAIEEVAAALGDKYEAIFKLKMAGKTEAEIKEETGIPFRTIRRHWALFLKELKKRFSEDSTEL